MLDNIIRFSIRNKLIIGLLILVLIGTGLYSLSRLPIDAVPDITDNQVMVITTTPNLAAQEVEQLVTYPVEQTMVSIPGIDNMRSFSRFGLSIVTIVFKENVDLYWARQQIQERLSLAKKNIPEGAGTPEMAPVTTGLGEIYQYVVHPKKGYEDKYDATKLRTIQDWIIKKQLLGTKGVAEVSGFGGYIKQYEIAVDPDRMNSMGISISEIFDALKKNNQNTGGAYIDKNPHTYFIRSEGLVKNIDELNKIVVQVAKDGTPILIRDVAKVKFGTATRYGAASRNGEGEVVTGIVMMLKGANSSEVINNVKEKIEVIKTTLPEGVTIEPFLDRSKLVKNAIHTVSKNLVEGALIVIFILILFLGNLRAGLVVASVIPLALLFAFSLMHVFGVSANLMSLGAIDFGLVVDGAVIIVEAIVHRIYVKGRGMKGVFTSQQMDDHVYKASSKIRTSASFGEIIILMVYLPLWTLTGVEGKMFIPMAMTVSFAILGAFLLSITYVPMMSALVLKRKPNEKKTLSDKMMEKFDSWYVPIIKGALKKKKLILGSSIAVFIFTGFVFSNMGGEFIPQLDEGDFAVETRVPVGSSMQQTMDASQKAQTILLNEFPEVIEAVSKLGSGEIPTDPMPIEAGDLMVILKPRSEWVSATSREELMGKMGEALEKIPNATFSFQQPIQMRFNELLTGAKQDVVLKIYGEELNVLSDLAQKTGGLIRNVDGVEDLYVEEVTGLPQININLNRDKIAQYGLDVETVNQTIQTAFAGSSAGMIYEKERRFDLVVRMDASNRDDITDVNNLYVESPTGIQVPLNELAKVSYEPGPIQIQRDNAKRRITLGFNVRNRDVESIVSDIKQIIGNKMSMPAGYYITYGGQFKNLKEAVSRLSIVLPIALFLILVLLYFTFRSIKQSFLIFTAIPMSAIGGVFALLLRGMPFSISACVGFIALFGVSVLNGIVLIGEFNRLRDKGVDDIYERIIQGARNRLRPVLMTAMVASFGFLPMALSTTSGAEIQRPLATVVIGGLITATILTLIVLPIIYFYFTEKHIRIKRKNTAATILIALFSISSFASFAQNENQNNSSTREITLEQAIQEAVKNNDQIKIADYSIQNQKAQRLGAFDFDKTDISFSQGSVNTPSLTDNVISISQKMDFPTTYIAKSRLAKEKLNSATRIKDIQIVNLKDEVKKAYLKYVFALEQNNLLQQKDSLFSKLSIASEKRYRAGESTKLESVSAQTQALKLKNDLEQNKADINEASKELQRLLQTEDEIIPSMQQMQSNIQAEMSEGNAVSSNPGISYLEQEVKVSKHESSLEKHKLLPDLTFGYSSQTYRGPQEINGSLKNLSLSDRFSSYQVGISIPILPFNNISKIKSGKINEKIKEMELHQGKLLVETRYNQLLQRFSKERKSVIYFKNQALPQANLILKQSTASFASGNISYFEYLQNISLALDIQNEYLEQVYQYNLTKISLETLLGN
ncbi:MAG: CusA/CzcA family heavy metal efflux RND transporter [Bacteroidales bacterium]